MRAKQLRELLVGVPDNMEVVVLGFDHDFVSASASVSGAHDNGGIYAEYGGQDCEADYGPYTEVFLVTRR